MIFHQINAGGDRNFAYIVGDRKSGKAAIFDPPPNGSLYEGVLEDNGLHLTDTFITHAHSDHTWGIDEARKRGSSEIRVHENSPLSGCRRVRDTEEIQVGSINLKILHTPGHTEDSMCILAGGSLITGDTLFVGKVGGTDFKNGAKQQWNSLHNKILTLDDRINIYPGHDYGIHPFSTIGNEKRTNPFILCGTFEDFVHLKKNWLQYKREHGID